MPLWIVWISSWLKPLNRPDILHCTVFMSLFCWIRIRVGMWGNDCWMNWVCGSGNWARQIRNAKKSHSTTQKQNEQFNFRRILHIIWRFCLVLIENKQQFGLILALQLCRIYRDVMSEIFSKRKFLFVTREVGWLWADRWRRLRRVLNANEITTPLELLKNSENQKETNFWGIDL